MANEWQRHSGKFLKEALKKAARSFRGKKKGPSESQKKSIKVLQRKREEINSKIKKMKGR